ncbi:MAG: helix-turn-helix transcriptional regulator, partial [Paracoccaceae bacterium]
RAFRNALKENQIAPFLENRDTFVGMSGQIASISSIKRNPIMLRFVNKIMKAVSQSYTIPEFLSKIGFNRKQFMVSAALKAGSTNKQIARQLGIKEATVKYHLTKMYKIAKVSKRAELIEFIDENKSLSDI